MRPIAVFYHALFYLERPGNVLDNAVVIVDQQMRTMEASGLTDAAKEIIVGINGGEESQLFADLLLPKKARKVYHGLESRAENLTIVEVEKWLPAHPDWYVLYFHAKGCTRGPGPYLDSVTRWRDRMMLTLVEYWPMCVHALDSGYDSVGCHWVQGAGSDHSQNYWAGNFWWAKASFLRTLPSIFLRHRIKMSGIAASDSRFEAEVWIGNGPRLPVVKDYYPIHPIVAYFR